MSPLHNSLSSPLPPSRAEKHSHSGQEADVNRELLIEGHLSSMSALFSRCKLCPHACTSPKCSLHSPLHVHVHVHTFIQRRPPQEKYLLFCHLSYSCHIPVAFLAKTSLIRKQEVYCEYKTQLLICRSTTTGMGILPFQLLLSHSECLSCKAPLKRKQAEYKTQLGFGSILVLLGRALASPT